MCKKEQVCLIIQLHVVNYSLAWHLLSQGLLSLVFISVLYKYTNFFASLVTSKETNKTFIYASHKFMKSWQPVQEIPLCT